MFHFILTRCILFTNAQVQSKTGAVIMLHLLSSQYLSECWKTQVRGQRIAEGIPELPQGRMVDIHYKIRQNQNRKKADKHTR